MTVVKGTPDIVTSPAPPFPYETYCLRLLEHATVDPIIRTTSFAVTNDLIMAFYIRFVDATPSSDLPFFRLTTTTRVHMILTLKTDGKLILTDAAPTTTTSAAACFASNTWHLVEIRLTKAGAGSGSCDVYVDGVSQCSATGNFSASSGNVEMRFTGSLTGATSRTFYLDNIVAMTGGSSVSDFKGVYRVCRFGKADFTATPDFGDALEAGTWGDCAETPHNDSNYAQYVSINQSGVVQTDSTAGGMTPGPKGDARLTGTILGCAFTTRWSADPLIVDNTFLFNRGAGDGSDGTAQVDLGTSSSVSVRHEVFDASNANCPTATEYFQYGMESAGFLSADVRLHECWCSLLHTSPPFRGTSLGSGYGVREREVLIG